MNTRMFEITFRIGCSKYDAFIGPKHVNSRLDKFQNSQEILPDFSIDGWEIQQPTLRYGCTCEYPYNLQSEHFKSSQKVA